MFIRPIRRIRNDNYSQSLKSKQGSLCQSFSVFVIGCNPQISRPCHVQFLHINKSRFSLDFSCIVESIGRQLFCLASKKYDRCDHFLRHASHFVERKCYASCFGWESSIFSAGVCIIPRVQLGPLGVRRVALSSQRLRRKTEAPHRQTKQFPPELICHCLSSVFKKRQAFLLKKQVVPCWRGSLATNFTRGLQKEKWLYKIYSIMTLTCTVCICLLVQGCFEHARRGNEALLSFEGCVSVHGKPDLHSKCRDSRSVQSLEDLGSISQWQFFSTIANAQETSRNTFLIYSSQ